MTDIKIIPKQKSRAFGKDVYLLGIRDKRFLWLESPSWDCDWYWGFGYIECYTYNRKPHLSKDIHLHTHYESLLWNHKNYAPILQEVEGVTACTLTTEEQWELSDLMKSYYTLKSYAELCHTGNSNYTHNIQVDLKDPEYENVINEKLIPLVTGRIIEMLSPKEAA